MSRTIFDVLDWIRATSNSTYELGAKFERAARFFLLHDPLYANTFGEVWLWADAPKNDGHDIGIDLVAQDRDGSYWAIQCKFYDEDSVLDYKQAATFFGTTGADKAYKHNMIILTTTNYSSHDAITDEALSVFRKAYPQVFDRRKTKEGGEELTKEDLFYYIYGILHSPEYRSRFDSNLKKELPRIPLAADFKAFSEAGRKLAHLHLNYETVEPWPLRESGDSITPGPVVKMTWGKTRGPSGKNVNDLSTIVYNKHLVLSGIPEKAHRYVVNGKSGLAWLFDRYRVTTDKASGIVNDPNEYSDDPRYIIDLIKRVTRVSVESMGIIDALPPLHEKDQPVDWPEAWKLTSESL